MSDVEAVLISLSQHVIVAIVVVNSLRWSCMFPIFWERNTFVHFWMISLLYAWIVWTLNMTVCTCVDVINYVRVKR